MVVTLALISEPFWCVFLARYNEGYQQVVARARDDIVVSVDQAWVDISRMVRGQAASPRFLQLADRRGDHGRAGRTRKWERKNGLAPIR